MNRIQWLIVSLALVPLILFAYLGQFSRILSDDNCQIIDGRELGAWDTMLKLYNIEGGRYAVFFLWGAVAPLDTHLPRIASAVIVVLWLIGWYWLAAQGLAFLKIGGSRRTLALAISALAVAAAINGFYTFESFFWYGAVSSHTLPVVLFTVYMALTVWMARRLRKNIRSLLGVIAGAVICFLVAGFSESHVVFQLIFLSFCLLMSFALLGSSVRYRYALVFGVGWLATLASLLVQLNAPGIAARLARGADKFAPPDQSLSAVAAKTLKHSFGYIRDPEVFAGFIMLMAVGLLVTLVKYKPRTLSKASKPIKITLPVLWLCLVFQLLWMPILWGHTSDTPQFFGRFSSGYMTVVALNIAFSLSFLIMLWQRKRMNAWLHKREPDSLFPFWFMAVAFIFAGLFALTQIETLYFYSSLYLFASLLVFLIVLTSLRSNAEERRFGLLALCSYGLGLVSILAVVLMLSYAVGYAVPRALAAGACLLVFSGLVWGAYIGYLVQRCLPSLQAGQTWTRFLKLGSLAIVLIIAANIVLSQAALVPDYQNFAKVWDANHQKIIALRDSGQDVIKVSPLPLHENHYLGGCPGRYYRLRSSLIIDDGG